MKKVIVITGLGGIGLAIARRIGTGYKLVLADFAQDKLEAAANDLTRAGYDVTTAVLDVASQKSVEGLAQTAAGLGPLHAVVHTAGLSSTMTDDPQRILQVNLIGTAHLIKAFESQLVAGTVGIMLASIAGHLATGVDPAWQKPLGTLPSAELLAFVNTLGINTSGMAYSVSKYGNLAQVQAAAVAWGQRGARLVSVSPGVIATPMGQQEMAQHPEMNFMLEKSPAQRIGTPEDIAAAVEFLQSPQASFITGTDLLVDGGVIALVKAMGAAKTNSVGLS